jgi:branched-chain amino acid transport system ATP-binding protein
MGSAILWTEGLTKSFGGLHAVDHVDYAVEEGKLQAIIGPNGAGKSTLFNLIAGSLKPTSGRVWFRGRDITRLPHHAVARLGIAKTYQITTIFKNLSVYENVRVAAQARHTTYDFWRRAESLKAGAVLDAVQLLHRRDAIAAELSHGEQRHLEIAIALAVDPVLLLLDEPTAGMSPQETEHTIGLIKSIAQGRSVVVEHTMPVVMSIADTITVLHNGQILAQGAPAAIQADPRVQEVCLGGRWGDAGGPGDLHLLWPQPRAAGGVAGRRGRRDRHPDRAQRRRQEHHP